MRFPLRLRAALIKAKLSGMLGGGSSSSRIAHATADEQSVALVRNTKASMVWLGGAEPLLHPEIGRLTSNLQEDNRYVFMHTNGKNLRQRLHMFRPEERLFLVTEFVGREERHNRVVAQPDAFQRSLEGIRAAKLSGFLVAAHVTVTTETDTCDIGELIEALDKLDVDGFVATSRGQSLEPNHQSLAETLDDVRVMIRYGAWEDFSRLLEESFGGQSRVRAGSENAFEEGD